jgi:hypothetical protein
MYIKMYFQFDYITNTTVDSYSIIENDMTYINISWSTGLMNARMNVNTKVNQYLTQVVGWPFEGVLWESRTSYCGIKSVFVWAIHDTWI